MSRSKCVCDPSNPTEQNVAICAYCQQVRERYLRMGYVAPDHIFGNIWLGGIASSTNSTKLEELGIDRILITIPGCCLKFFPRSFDYLQVPMDPDFPGILPYLDTMADFISEAKIGILVHDTGGAKRSGLAIVAYLMKYQNFSLREACELVAERRKTVHIPPGYQTQLQEFVRILEERKNVKPQAEEMTDIVHGEVVNVAAQHKENLMVAAEKAEMEKEQIGSNVISEAIQSSLSAEEKAVVEPEISEEQKVEQAMERVASGGATDQLQEIPLEKPVVEEKHAKGIEEEAESVRKVEEPEYVTTARKVSEQDIVEERVRAEEEPSLEEIKRVSRVREEEKMPLGYPVEETNVCILLRKIIIIGCRKTGQAKNKENSRDKASSALCRDV
eukprot:TRINITY_DN2282_c0_g1_i1.p3 TRINITY_DN2282_c0_g1~~TRINITY_DN2282_c0_g1_i1.p3  ORF type:complete len:388 (-),score=52.13 TRINITY_DN2282_c0_g1_i1:1287-2450(-)